MLLSLLLFYSAVTSFFVHLTVVAVITSVLAIVCIKRIFAAVDAAIMQLFNVVATVATNFCFCFYFCYRSVLLFFLLLQLAAFAIIIAVVALSVVAVVAAVATINN